MKIFAYPAGLGVADKGKTPKLEKKKKINQYTQNTIIDCKIRYVLKLLCTDIQFFFA